MRLKLFRNSMTAVLGAAAMSLAAGCPGTVMEVSAAQTTELGTDAAGAAAEETTEVVEEENVLSGQTVTAAEESSATAASANALNAAAGSSETQSVTAKSSEEMGSAGQSAATGNAADKDTAVKSSDTESSSEDKNSENAETGSAAEVDMEVIMSDPELFEQYYQQLSAQVEALQKQQEEEAAKAEENRNALASQTRSTSWKGTTLSRLKGTNKGPGGKETYYNLNMSKVVAKLKSKGYEGEYWVRNDGVKMYGDYIMVAANYAKYPYGSIVETSLGTGIVCDTGLFAWTSNVTFDIATNWR